MVLYSIIIILHYDYRRGGSQGGPAGQDPERKAVQRQTPRLALLYFVNIYFFFHDKSCTVLVV